jgi:hypothetical protein
MITVLASALPIGVIAALGVLALKFGAEDRPGFDERAPLN